MGQGRPAPADLPSISVVVVSRGRPDELRLCLGALALQDHPRIEVVLVADPPGLGLRPDLPLKRVAFDRPNISVARNLGIAAAAGAVLAFIDDDAVAEPGWAAGLAAAFAAGSAVIAAGGWTRGPYGRTWQSRGEWITPQGPVPLTAAERGRTLFHPDRGRAMGLVGTNCAFRRSALVAVGGFDPAFAYHLDESDLAMRLARAFPAALSALVPGAQITHGSAPSERRDAQRAPRDLRVIARSEAIFAARYGGRAADILPRLRRSLVRHMLAGRIEPWRIAALLGTARLGLAEAARPPGLAPDDDTPAAARAPSPHPSAPADPQQSTAPEGPRQPAAFRPMPTRRRDHVVISGGWSRRRALRARAAEAVAAGGVVTLILLVPGPLPHRSRFTPGGWWEQMGGTFGPSQPGDPALLLMSQAARAAREAALLAASRGASRGAGVMQRLLD